MADTDSHTDNLPAGQLMAENAGRQSAGQIFPDGDGRFQAFWEIAPDAMVLSDAAGIVIDANPAYFQLYGYAPEQVIGHSFAIIFPDSERSRAVEQYRAIFIQPEPPPYFESVVRRADGTQRLVETRINFIEQAGRRRAMLSIIRDITAQKRQDERLRLLESVVEHTTDGVLVTEAAPLDPPGPQMVYVNQALTRLTGYTKEELIGQNPRLFQGPKTDRLALDQVRQALIHNRPVTVEIINYTKAGREYWVELSVSPVVDETGTTTHFVALQRDITGRKRAKEAMEISQERYRLATRAARVGVWDWNLHTGEFYLDPTIKAILGYTDEEIPNEIEVWTGYIHPADRQAVMAAARAHVEGRTPEYSYEHRMLHKDGSVRWVLVRGKVIKDGQGQAMRMVGTDTDITGRKEAEEKLRRQIHYAEALAHCSRTLLMASRGEIENRRLLGEALKHLIEPARASKIFLYENFDDPELGFCSRFIMDVCAPGVPSALEDPKSAVIPWSIAPEENRRRLAAGEPVGGPVRRVFDATPPFRDHLLNKVHVLSVQFFPIHFGESWWGYVGFDDRVHEREWQQEEILLLSTAAEMLSSTLQRWRAEEKLRTSNDRLEQQVKSRTAALQQSVDMLEQEIKERNRAEAEIRRVLNTLEQRVATRTRQLAAFFDVITLAGGGQELADVLEPALARILEISTFQAICVHLLSPDRTALRLAAKHNLSDEVCREMQEVSIQGNFVRQLNTISDPIIISDVDQSSILSPQLRLEGFQAYLGTQIRVRGRPQGLLSCYDSGGHAFSLDETSLIAALAELLGVLVENHRLRGLAEEMAVLEERQRLARNLHDSVTQSLYSQTLFARSAQEAAADDDPGRLATSLAELETGAQYALREMRLLLYELRPLVLEEEGLPSALRHRLDTVERRLGLTPAYEIDEKLNLPHQVELELYYIAIEALNNVLKHATAGQIVIRLAEIHGQIRLEISDDGCGFDPEQVSPGLGLTNLRERTKRLNGTLEILSAPGEGTNIRVAVDL